MNYRINYSKVISQTDTRYLRVQELAAQIELIEQLEQYCKSTWKGEASSTFISKLGQLKGEMAQTRSQITLLASTIKACANRIHRADLEAARLAQIRSL